MSRKKAPPPAIQKQEMIKCAKDPSYFINKYVKISEPVRGLIDFKTFPYQEECLKAFVENQYTIVNKSRQLGLSTLAAGYALWMCIFSREKSILVAATQAEVARKFQDKVLTGLDNLPPWLMIAKVIERNKSTLRLSNGSKVQSIAASANAARGSAVSLLVIDEAAHIKDVEELWVGIQPTLSCVAADTLILTDKGYEKISNYFPEGHQPGDYFELKIPIYGKNGMEYTSHGYVSPINETIIATTRSGHRIETTPIHPLYVLQDNGKGKMVQMQHVRLGDHFRIESNMRQFGKIDLHEDLAYMLGGYIAEGWILKRRKNNGWSFEGIQVENSAREFREVFLRHKLSGKTFTENKSRKTRLSLYSKAAVEEFVRYGINPMDSCREKEIPKAVLQGNKKTVSGFLSGLFDGDGSVSERGITISSTSQKLIQQTQSILLNYGIMANVNKGNSDLVREKTVGIRVMPQGKKLQSISDFWILTIPLSQTKIFVDNIGFKIDYKHQKCLEIMQDREQDDYRQYKIPAREIEGKIKELIQRSGFTGISLRENHGVRIDKCFTDAKNGKSRYVTKRWLENFKSAIQSKIELNEDDIEFFNEHAGTFFWDEVVSLEKSENITYDFTVPDTHSFLQNCILGSNTGGKAILISSPNGVGNLFHRIWDGAEKGTNNFKAIELPWTVHPERDQEWFEKQRSAIIAAQGERGVKQELLCQFNGSGDTFISGEVMDILESRVEPPKFKHEKYHHAWIWKEPVPGHKYVISADIARGNAEDYSTFCIIDIDEEEVVSDYRNKIDPVKFAEVLSDLGNMYNQAIIAPELNSYGLLTAKELKDIGYQNLFYEKYQRNAHMTAREIPEDELPGIVTSAKNRSPFLAKFESVLMNGSIRIYSKRLVEELKTFVWRAGKAQAQKGYNDDLIMAYAIAVNLFENTGKQKYSEDELRMAMFLGMSRTTKGLSSWTGDPTGEELVMPIFSSNNIIGQGNKFIEKRKEMLTKQGYLRNDGSKARNNPQHPANPMWNEYKWLLD